MPRKITDLIKLIKNNEYIKNVNTMTVEELVKILKKLSDTYYNTGQSIVSDEIYDYIREILKEKDPENSFLYEIGAPIKGTKEKVKLPFPMGSLTKVKPEEDTLTKWLKKYNGPFIISDKLDGASAQLYKDTKGETFLYSRGNGIYGQNISHLLKYLVNDKIIKKLPNNISIRGELVITKDNFEKIASYMKNARNTVAGLVNSKTVDIKIAKLTDFVTYALLHPRYKQSDQMILLKELGFNVVINKKINNLTENDLKTYLIERKKQSLYEIDGLVICDDSIIYEHKGGYPDYSFAFKMMTEDQVVIATVIRVIWNPSMNGYLKPTVEIEPVNLFGTTVTYATGKNAKFIVDNKIGKGAKIKITKGGEVIPDILQVVKEGKDGAQLPDLDDDDYDWNETEVDFVLTNLEGINAVIVNTKLITYFFKIIGVKYLSEGIITKLVENGYNTIVKILKADKKKISQIEGLGDIVVKKIYDEIDRSFNDIDLVTFMTASHKFGKGLGEKKIREILNMYPNILIEDWKKKEMIDNILEVNGFSNKLAELFTNKFNEFKKFYLEISKIKDLTRFEEEINFNSDKNNDILIFDGKSIVFTGFRDKDLEKQIIKLGGKVVGSVSTKTFILVCKDDADITSSKFKQASNIGVKVMTKSEFIDKYDL